MENYDYCLMRERCLRKLDIELQVRGLISWGRLLMEEGWLRGIGIVLWESLAVYRNCWLIKKECLGGLCVLIQVKGLMFCERLWMDK